MSLRQILTLQAGHERRRFLSGLLIASVMVWTGSMPLATRAASAPAVPLQTVRDLDFAAMALFEAAEKSDWTAAKIALDRARQSAATVSTLESAFVDAGGALEHYFEVTNNLGADLIEAETALSVKDKRWLVNSADRITARAGALSQPFNKKGDTVTPKIETLLFLARQMRRAIIWQDDTALFTARAHFKRLWQSLQKDLASAPADRMRALKEALNMVESGSADGTKALYLAVKQLRLR